MSDSCLQRHKLGFLELKEKPSQEELSAYYERVYFQSEKANYRKSYTRLELEMLDLRNAQREHKVNQLLEKTGRGRKMLDVGCGEGFTLRYFHEQGWDVTGIDFSKAGIEQFNPSYSSRVLQGDIFQLLDDLNKSKNKYELIWLANVLEHVLDPVELLKSLHHHIQDGGLLICTVPNDGNDFHEWLLHSGCIEERWWIAIPDHISYFNSQSLKQLTTATGWKCLSLQADFPVDWFLAHPGSNYLGDPENGKNAHQVRLQIENLIGKNGHEKANKLYEALADVGLGRNLTVFLSPIKQN